MIPILVLTTGAVGVIRLNRPEKLNAFNREMSSMLMQCLDNFATDLSVRAILLTGNGKAFSAGQDLSELLMTGAPAMDRLLAEQYNPIVRRIRHIPKPVLCAVNGMAAGAGANIALCCDVVVAAQSASFLQAFSKIGLIPDSGGTYFLPRLIGWQKASALAMLAEPVSATDAERWGMIYKVLQDDTFAHDALQLAERLSQMPTRGLALTKKALNNSFTNTLDDQLQLEDQLQQEAAKTNDYQEGVNAFLQKRKPNFTGQ